MKAVTYSRKTVVVLAILLAFSSLQFVQGKDNQNNTNSNPSNFEFTENGLKTLELGIASDNLGLKRCCIYFVGKYKLVSLADAVITQLKKETDPDTKILIALVLYKLENEKGMKAVQDLAILDENPRVKKMSFEILTAHDMIKAENVADRN